MPEIPSLPVQGAYIADKKAEIKGALELGNVDNTRDVDKPVSTLTQAELSTLAGRVTAAEAAIIALQGSLAAINGGP